MNKGANSNVKLKERSAWKFVSLVIGVIVLFFLLKFIFDKNPAPPEKIYASYYYPDPGLPVTMGSEVQDNFELGMQSYQQGDYAEALKSWQKVPANKADGRTSYFVGSALLALEKEAEAVDYFNQIDANVSFFEKANWYLLLIAIKNGNWQEARQLHGILTRIPPTLHLEELREIGDLIERNLEREE